jgi:hypothetical protein
MFIAVVLPSDDGETWMAGLVVVTTPLMTMEMGWDMGPPCGLMCCKYTLFSLHASAFTKKNERRYDLLRKINSKSLGNVMKYTSNKTSPRHWRADYPVRRALNLSIPCGARNSSASGIAALA